VITGAPWGAAAKRCAGHGFPPKYLSGQSRGGAEQSVFEERTHRFLAPGAFQMAAHQRGCGEKVTLLDFIQNAQMLFCLTFSGRTPLRLPQFD
jgi:hypothetical protein